MISIGKSPAPLDFFTVHYHILLWIRVVEAVGVEPTSKNISTETSPSAVSIFIFPRQDPY